MHNGYTPPLVIRIMSITLGFYLSMGSLSQIIFSSQGAMDTGGALGKIYIACVAIMLLCAFISKSFKLSSVSKSVILIEAYICIFYLYTTNRIGQLFVRPDLMFMFTIAGFMLPSIIKIDVKTLLRSMMIFSVPAIFMLNRIFVYSIQSDDIISMSISYAFLSPVLVSVVYYKYYYPFESLKQKWITRVLFAANMVFGYYIVAYGSRGPVVAFLALIAFMYIIVITPYKKGLQLHRSKVSLLALFGLLLYTNFLTLLIALKTMLAFFGVSLNFVNKFITQYYERNGDMTSGRDVIYEHSIKGIWENPILGHGMDQFYNNTGWPYPHNCLIQLFYDGGLVFALLLLYPLLRSVIKKREKYSYEEIVLLIFLFFASVPGSMFSGDLWTEGKLWIFMGVLLSTSVVYKRN